jgi:DNA-binding CsgD family transcriptional regulator
VRTTTGARHLLIGRREECARLDRLIADARSGTSVAVTMRGEAGVGKTALLDYVLGQAAGCRIVRSSGVESEMELPYAGLHQLCTPFLGQLEQLPGPQGDALATAFELRFGPPPDRFLVGLAVLTLLADVAETQPLICLIDDAQWLDRASAQVLGFVARRLAAESIVMLFALREPTDISDFAGLPDLAVGPLEEPYARTVLISAVPGPIDEPVRERILAEAAGNPLALLELPRGWTPAFAGGFGLPDTLSVSAKVEESFRRRLSPLPDDTRRLLLVAAADPVGDRALVLAAAGRIGLSAEAAEPAATTGLLEINTQVRFRHPLVRSVVYRGASAAERRLVHGALAEETDPVQEPDRRAWHLAAAAVGPDEEVAAELERSAGRAQARGGVAAAAAFLQRAVELTPDQSRRAERGLVAAEATFLAGAFDAVERLVADAEAYPLDGFQRARAALLRGHVAVVLGYGNDAPPLLLDAARQLEPFDLDLARGAYLTAYGSAMSAAHLAQPGILLELCRAAEALPQSTRPSGTDLLLEGLARMHTDGRGVAVPILRRALSLLAELPAGDVVRWGWCTPMASNVVWDADAATAIFERQAAIVRAAGALAELPISLHALAQDRLWSGEFDSAAQLIAEGDDVASATGSRVPPFTNLRLVAMQGKEAEATALIEATIATGETVGVGLAIRIAQWASAILYNALGRYDEAARAASLVTTGDIDPYPWMWVLTELVEAAVRTGDTDTARRALERLAETTQPAGTDFALGIEARSRALLSDGDDAERRYQEAIDRLGRTRLRPDFARAHLLFGEWLRREGRRVDARNELRAAHDLFVVIGMEAFAERARRELLATGETVRKRSVETQDQLTPQELQIARLAANGHTNPEIGAQLFLSRRTVEWHLRKVFDKLDIGSRRELQAALRGGQPGSYSGPAQRPR